MSIILVRHGETALNVGRVLQPADTPLSERGRMQAAALARRVAGLGAKALLSSDMPRALATAEAIAAATGLPLRTSGLLQERNFGDLRGRPYDTLDFDPLVMEAAPPNGESAPAFRERVAQAFADVVALRATLDGSLVVVTHGLVIRVLLGTLLPAAQVAALPVANTSLTVLAALPPHAAEVLDSIAHLDAGQQDTHSLSGG